MRLLPALIAAITLSALSCTRGHSTSTPRPEAYPRIAMPDSTFTQMNISGISLAINDGAVADVEEKENGDCWITIGYPSFSNASIYLTLSNATKDEPAEAIVDNRRERMALNLAGADGIATTLTSSGGWDCEMITSRSALSTPVQILASKDGRVISGTVYLQIPHTTPTDSVSPVIDALERDMLTLLKAL